MPSSSDTTTTPRPSTSTWGLDRPRTWLALALALGAVLRIVAALSSSGFDHPNEAYRLLEPIAGLDGFSTRLPWEWTQGLLSPLPVHAARGLLHLAAALGIADPEAQATLLRLFYAALSLLPIVAVWELLGTGAGGIGAGGARSAGLLSAAGALAVTVSPELVFRSVRLMDYTLEAGLLAGALWLLVRVRRGPEWAGLLLGVLFFVRFQSGLHFLALLGFIGLTPAPDRARRALRLTGAYALTVGGLGLVEMAYTHDAFLGPFRRYVHFNWAEDGAARLYGVAPWHRYFSEASKFYGHLPFVALAALCFRRTADRRIAWLFAFPFLVLTLISHKEGRFIYGFAWLLIPAGLSGLRGVFGPRVRADRPGWPPTWLWPASALAAAIVVAGLGVQLSRVAERFRVQADEVAAFSEIGRRLAAGPGDLDRLPLVVDGDPDFLPGAFFLRHHGPLCYRGGAAPAMAGCGAGTSDILELTRNASPGAAALYEAGGWRVRRSPAG